MAVDIFDPSEVNVRVRALLKERGLRFSRPRAAILGFFLEGDRHVSAEALRHAVLEKGSSLSLSTVYLNLAVLCEAGLVRELRGIDGVALFDSTVVPHSHVVCSVSGEVIDVPALDVNGVPLGRYLKEIVEAATGWQVSEPVLGFEGVSPRAASKKS